MSYPVIPCAYCNQPGHKASRCKELGLPPDGEIIKPLPGQNDIDEDSDNIAIPGNRYEILLHEEEDVIRLHGIKNNIKLSGQKRIHKQLQTSKNKKQKYINTLCLTANKRVEP
jgi:hypothetical protein